MSVSIPAAFTPLAKGITLYSLETPNGVKVSIALAILNIPFKIYVIDIIKNIQKEAWFIENINPNGRIPAIIDATGDGKSIRLFESGAILQYLVDKYDKNNKLSYPYGTSLYYETMQWVYFQTSGVGPMQGQANHFKIYAATKIQYGIDRYMNETNRLYSVLERQLTKNGTGYLVGDHVSIADVATLGWVASSYALEMDLKSAYPLLFNWAERMIKLPGVAKGLNTPHTWRGFTSGIWNQPK